jgi:ethanolamine-phosphate cytidylyltransferase
LSRYGDYVIVGVHNDSVVNQIHGLNLPILTMQERVLSVLGCKVTFMPHIVLIQFFDLPAVLQWVDDVLLDAPYILTREIISSLRISVVLRGTVGPSANPDPSLPDPFAAAAELGIQQTIEVLVRISVIGAALTTQFSRCRLRGRLRSMTSSEGSRVSRICWLKS